MAIPTLPRFLFVSLLLAIPLSAGAFSATDSKYIVAETAHWQITRAELDAETNSYCQRMHIDRSQLDAKHAGGIEAKVLDLMISKRLLMAEAERLPPVDAASLDAAAFQRFRAHFQSQDQMDEAVRLHGITMEQLKQRIHDDAVIQQVLDVEVFRDISVTDSEARDFYEKNPGLFTAPPEVRVSRVLIMSDPHDSSVLQAQEEKAIEDARERVVAGEDFAEVAREVSQDKYSASHGGDIGFFRMGTNEGAFDAVAFQTKVGMLSPVFKTMVGYWFLKVTGYQPANVVPFDQARPTATAAVTAQKRKFALEEFLVQLRKEDGVKRHALE